MSTANERQIGGEHYKAEDGEQHWDRMWRLYREAWFVGNITKYVERYREKNGIQDLEKARHYLDKLIELEKSGVESVVVRFKRPPHGVPVSRMGDDPHDA